MLSKTLLNNYMASDWHVNYRMHVWTHTMPRKREYCIITPVAHLGDQHHRQYSAKVFIKTVVIALDHMGYIYFSEVAGSCWRVVETICLSLLVSGESPLPKTETVVGEALGLFGLCGLPKLMANVRHGIWDPTH